MSSPQSALARLRAFVDADPDLCWRDARWEQSRAVAPVDLGDGRRVNVPGMTSTTITMTIDFVSRYLTAVEELERVLGR